MSGSRVLDEPTGDAFLDRGLRRVLIEEHADVALREASPHDEHVADAAGIVFGAREVATLCIGEVDIVADPDDERPASQVGTLLRPECYEWQRERYRG